jgi:hypothetical protein
LASELVNFPGTLAIKWALKKIIMNIYGSKKISSTFYVSLLILLYFEKTINFLVKNFI